MIVDLPSTDTSAVNRTMVDLRESAGAVALGRVLTLLIITEDGPEAEAAIQAANDASREHPCRVLVLARGIRRAASRLDAQIRIGGDAGASEVIVLRMYGPLADQGGAIVVPLLLPDAPIVAWWPGEAPTSPSEDPVGSVAGRRITDVGSAKSPSKALAKLRQRYAPGDTDLAWSRITSWRALLTAALDQPPHDRVTRAAVGGAPDSASADLLTGWLASRLGCPVLAHHPGRAGRSGRADRDGAPRAGERVDRAGPPGREERDALPARAARPSRRPLPAHHPRVPGRGAAPARPRRHLRRGHRGDADGPRPVQGLPHRGEGGRMSTPEVVVHPDTDTTASDAADRLITALAAAQAARGTASVVLTGGGVGIAMLREVASSGRRDAVDWGAVEVFWGDERFVPAGDAERNDAQAREALLDALPLDPARVHPMAPSDAPEEAGGGDPDLAADVYAKTLSSAASRLGGDAIPAFDVLLAGCGPEGHVLSVFPDSPAVHATAAGVVAVRDCPKPPPTRVSLTLAAARHAREVWLVATGEGKAEVIARAYAGAAETDVPIAGLRGTERTLWLLDEAAAGDLSS